MGGDNAKIHLLQEKLKEAAELFLSLEATCGESRQSDRMPPQEGDSVSSGIPGADALIHWIQDRPSPQLAPVEGEGVATALLAVMAALEAFDDAVADGLQSRQSISGEWFVGRELNGSESGGES